MPDPRQRRSGLAALIGGVLLVILTLLETYAFHGGASIGWVVAARPIMEPIVRLARTVTPADAVVYLFARPQALAFVFLLLGYRSLHAQLAAPSSRSARVGYYLARLALLLALAGNVSDAWLGTYVWGTPYEGVAAVGAGLLVVGAVVLSAGSLLLGYAVLRTPLLPAWMAVLLISAAAGSIPLAFLLIHGLSAVYLGFGLAWIGLGYRLWRGSPAPSVQH